MLAGFLGAIYLARAEWAPDARGRRHLQPRGRLVRYLPDPDRVTPAGRPLFRRALWLLGSAVAGLGIAAVLFAIYERAP